MADLQNGIWVCQWIVVAELGQIQGMVFDIWVNVTMEATTGTTILTPYLSLIFA